MAPKIDPRTRKNIPAPASSSFLSAKGAKASTTAPPVASTSRVDKAAGGTVTPPTEVRRDKRQLSLSAEKSVPKKQKDGVASYDPREAATPLPSSFLKLRPPSPSASSVTTMDADHELESDTDVEAAAATPAVVEATAQLGALGNPNSKVCRLDLE